MPRKAKDVPLPRYWKVEISRITGLRFCDRECGCGENSQLWFTPVPGDYDGTPDWIPGWMNGCGTDEIWEWLVENGKVPPKKKRKSRK